ncbi:hypothetical protein [Streptomyces sp. B6B3]|uniref:hypothetical protein n=1 Tax=Streptomyces sp. B6B3 TaxID=3153570 RepID=UPI00325D097D
MATAAVLFGVIVASIGLLWFLATRRDRRLLRYLERPSPGPVQGRMRVPAGDARANELANELLAIGRRGGFLTMQGKDARTRAIGAELDRMGGMQMMLDVHDVVAAEIGRLPARELEAAWDGIGDWMG